MSEEMRACHGAPTVSCRMGPEHAQQCQHCKTKVRDDLVNHRLFGFKQCEQRNLKRSLPTTKENQHGKETHAD